MEYPPASAEAFRCRAGLSEQARDGGQLEQQNKEPQNVEVTTSIFCGFQNFLQWMPTGKITSLYRLAHNQCLSSIYGTLNKHNFANKPLREHNSVKENYSRNRLIDEKSHYLLQHAENPVDWYPWGEEAFEKARKENKPIFLSIGYSTCHWCHVMAHESFEDEEVAGVLNKSFVSIKVDREERPDVDMVYMAACQAITLKGGWPLSVFMTPEGKPFFAGTYFPKTGRMGMPGFLDLTNQIAVAWQNNRGSLLEASEKITRGIQPRPAKGSVTELGLDTLFICKPLFLF